MRPPIIHPIWSQENQNEINTFDANTFGSGCVSGIETLLAG